jgi:phage-related tail protein
LTQNPSKAEVHTKIQKLKELSPETNFDIVFKIWKKLNPNQDVGIEEIDSASIKVNNTSLFSGLASSVKDRGKSIWGNVKNIVSDQATDSMIANVVSQFYNTSGDHKDFANDHYIDTLLNREIDTHPDAQK